MTVKCMSSDNNEHQLNCNITVNYGYLCHPLGIVDSNQQIKV